MGNATLPQREPLEDKRSIQSSIDVFFHGAPAATDAQDEHEHSLDRMDLARIAFVAVAAAIVWFHLPFFKLIGAAGIAIGIYPIVREPLKISSKKR